MLSDGSSGRNRFEMFQNNRLKKKKSRVRKKILRSFFGRRRFFYGCALRGEESTPWRAAGEK